MDKTGTIILVVAGVAVGGLLLYVFMTPRTATPPISPYSNPTGVPLQGGLPQNFLNPVLSGWGPNTDLQAGLGFGSQLLRTATEFGKMFGGQGGENRQYVPPSQNPFDSSENRMGNPFGGGDIETIKVPEKDQWNLEGLE